MPPLRSGWRALMDPALIRFCLVGASGYLVNLSIYRLSLDVSAIGPLLAAVAAFLAAATSNYQLNRRWTFNISFSTRWTVVGFLAVAVSCLGLNILFLRLALEQGVQALPGQALAIAAVTPINFVATRAVFLHTSKRATPAHINEITGKRPGD